MTTSNTVYPIMERATRISILVDAKASKMSLKEIDVLVSEIAVITNAVVNDLTPSQGVAVASKLSPAVIALNERVDTLKARRSARFSFGWLPLVAVSGIVFAIISEVVNALN